MAGWRRITDAIHAHRSFLFVQLWALGRTARAEVLEAEPEGPFNVVSASATQLDEKHAEAKPLTKEEIKEWVNDYAAAAQRSLEAGADGVEIHGANGVRGAIPLGRSKIDTTCPYSISSTNSSRTRPTSVPTNTAARLRTGLASPSRSSRQSLIGWAKKRSGSG